VQIKSITRKTIPASFDERITRLNRLKTEWTTYFKLANMHGKLLDIDVWTRRRLRMLQRRTCSPYERWCACPPQEEEAHSGGKLPEPPARL